MNYAWNALLSIFSFFLPFSGQPKEDTTFELDMALIDGARVRGGDEQLLEEARRLRDIENARSLRATASAQFYLGGLIALLPLLFSLLSTDLVQNKLNGDTISKWLAVSALGAGSIYCIGALVFALRVLKVQAYHRIDVLDLATASSAKLVSEKIFKQILKTVRCDRFSINKKVLFLKLSQMHVGRMYCSFLFSFFVLFLGEFVGTIGVVLIELVKKIFS